MSMSMEPLAPWAKKMTMIHGLSGQLPVAVTIRGLPP